MRSNVEVLEQLFDELTSTCKTLGITLFGVTRDAERLAEGILKRKYVYAVDFAVYAEDFGELLHALEGRDNFAVESLENNPHMPGIGIRFTDKDSLYYDPTDAGSFCYNGIHLNIWPLIRRPKNGFANKIINLKERFWEKKETYELEPRSFGDKCKEGLIRVLFKLFGEQRTGRSLMKRCLSRSAAAKGKYTFHLPNGVICEMTAKEIRSYPCIETRGIMMKCFPSDSTVHRKYYRLRRLTKTFAVFSSDVPWEDLVQFDGIGSESKRKDFIKNIRKRNENYIVALNDAMDYWKLMEMSYERVQFYRDFYPQKDALMNLYHEKRYEELSDALDLYIKALTRYNKKNLTLCFDVDFFEMAMAVLVYKDRPERAAKLLRNVKLEHMESVGEYLQREEMGLVLDMEMCRKRQAYLEEMLGFMEQEISIRDNSIKDTDPDSAEDSQDKPPFERTEQGGKIHIYIYARNLECEPENLGKTGEQEIIVNGPSIDELNTEVEYNNIHFIVDAEITKTPVWQSTLTFSFEGLEENERLEYVGYGSVNYYRDKMALCYLMQLN